MKNKTVYTNQELTDLLYAKTIQLKSFNSPELKNIIKDLDFVLDEVHARLSIASKRAFKNSLIGLFDAIEYDTIEECFNDLNNDYTQYFGEPMYLNYKQFEEDAQ